MFYHQGSTWGSYNKQVRLPFLIWVVTDTSPIFSEDKHLYGNLGCSIARVGQWSAPFGNIWWSISLSLSWNPVYHVCGRVCRSKMTRSHLEGARWFSTSGGPYQPLDPSSYHVNIVNKIHLGVSHHSCYFAIQYSHNLLGCTLLITLVDFETNWVISHSFCGKMTWDALRCSEPAPVQFHCPEGTPILTTGHVQIRKIRKVTSRYTS